MLGFLAEAIASRDSRARQTVLDRQAVPAHVLWRECGGDRQSSPQTRLVPRKIREPKGTSGFAFGYMPFSPPLWVSVEQKYKDSCTANAGGVGLEFLWELFFCLFAFTAIWGIFWGHSDSSSFLSGEGVPLPLFEKGVGWPLAWAVQIWRKPRGYDVQVVLFFALLSSCYQRAALRSNCGGAQCTMCIFYDHFRPCSMTLAFFASCDSQHFRDGILGLHTVSKTPTTQIIHTSNRNPDDRRKHKHK
jgi:hypothetical protein